ncbi:MAG TPA: hypothetical protein ENN09_01275 [Planctomycetes bacterium]|nr:hypothetical protein [Planctomycetota bacterium]
MALKTHTLLLAGLAVIALAIFMAGCGAKAAQPLYPGTGHLVSQGAPLDGGGLPPGAPLPKITPSAVTPTVEPAILEKYRHGLE